MVVAKPLGFSCNFYDITSVFTGFLKNPRFSHCFDETAKASTGFYETAGVFTEF